MTRSAHDVVVVGAGADGPALAKRLGERGISVLILEAGPWYGNEKWPDPNEGGSGEASSSPDDLDHELLEEQLTRREHETNDLIAGKLRWGPANRDDPPWFRNLPQKGAIQQVAGVGGTSQHYFANHPRAYPTAFDDQPHWPIDYADLVPYYRTVEEFLPVEPAPTTAKEELFFQGADAAGYEVVTTKDVTEAGYRNQPNAITQPDEDIDDPDTPLAGPDVRGSVLAGPEYQGPVHPLGAPVDEKAKRSSLVSWVPAALETGHVTIRPNAFVTRVVTDTTGGTVTATGVEFRDTWTGETHEVSADVVVLAAGSIETPRLWLKSELPDGEWVGQGMTTHWFDMVVGVFDEETLEEKIGQPTLNPHVGQVSAARYEEPGVGCFETFGYNPGLASLVNYAFSRTGYSFDQAVDPADPWDSVGRVVGRDLKSKMADYRRTLSLIVLTDDRPRQENGVALDPDSVDEHGPVPLVQWEPHPDDSARREQLTRTAATVLRAAGASHVHRVDWPPLLLHIQSTMRMGEVTDAAGEAAEVARLFIGDHSLLANGVGGVNPTHTGQALALRTADHIAERYYERE